MPTRGPPALPSRRRQSCEGQQRCPVGPHRLRQEQRCIPDHVRDRRKTGSFVTTAGAAGIDAYCKAGGRKVNNATFIAVIAEPRYWEDATINGKVDEDGSLVPCRNGTCWEPVIRLEDGLIQNWPQGTTASIHYKVCDQGLYWLLDADGNRIAKWWGDYVPDEFLCHGDNGHGDYIIFAVNGSGFIENWRRPQIDESEWQAIEHDGGAV